MSDPLHPGDAPKPSLAPGAAAEPRPSDEDVVKALAEIEEATQHDSQQQSAPPPVNAAPHQSWFYGNSPVVVWIAFVIATIIGAGLLLAHAIRRSAKDFARMESAWSHAKSGAKSDSLSGRGNAAVDPATQDKAEKLLARVAEGDSAAASQVVSASKSWTGKTHRTPRTDRLVSASINFPSLAARRAALDAELAFNGVPRNRGGLAAMEQAVGDPNQRAWALWMLGALGSSGIDPVHTAKIIESYLDDPNVKVRATAVDALSLVATEETIPMLLDRFRNDPSPVVQERAICDIAQSGMYTHAQRMIAAASMVGWLDDSILSAQQRAWTAQALSDISGKHFGADSAAWKSWLESGGH